jgi:Ca2+-binding EF-hand superfamily protein
MDKDNTGVLNAKELKAAMKASKIPLSKDAEIDKIIN